MTGWIGKMRLLKILSNKFQKSTIHSYMIVSISLVTKASHATITTQILRKKKYSCKTTWCQNSYIDQTKCIVGEDRSENSDNYKTLCSNHTFWKSSDCDTKTFKGNYFLVLF